MHRPFSVILLATAALGACAGSAPESQHAAPSHERVHLAADTALPPLRYAPRYVAERRTYLVDATTIVRHDSAGGPHVDTVDVRSIVHADPRWTSRGLEVHGSIVSRITTASTRSAPDPDAVDDPVPFIATVDTSTSRVSFVSDSAAAAARPCVAPTVEGLAAARDLLTAVPRSLAPGATWSDSLVTTVCRGSLAVASAAVRRFTVSLIRAPADPAGVEILVTHTTVAHLHGAGAMDDAATTIEGDRHATAEQRYDALTGRLIAGETRSDLELHTDGPTQHSVIHQHATTTVKPVADN
jgi:hypothetical protein